jgi:hypothetical protein
MKKILLFALAMLIAVGVFAKPVAADATDDVSSISSELSTAFDTLKSVLANDSSTESETITAVNKFGDEAQKAEKSYAAISGATTEQSKIIADLGDNAGNLGDDAVKMSDALTASDKTAYILATEQLNTDTSSNNSIMAKWNDNVKSSNNGGLIGWIVATVVAALIAVASVIFFVKTKKQTFETIVKDKKGISRKISMKAARINVLAGAIVLLVGLLIPTIQVAVLTAGDGGKYSVFYYPMALGVIYLIFGVAQYVQVRAMMKKAGAKSADITEAKTEVKVPKIGSKDPNKKK